MVAKYNDDGPSYSKQWPHRGWNDIKCGLENIPKAGQLVDVTDLQTVVQYEALTMKNCRVKVAKISTKLMISQGSVYTIIQDDFGMSKVSAIWVP